MATEKVVKQVGRPAFVRRVEGNEDLRQELEDAARGREFPGSVEDVAKAIEPFTPQGASPGEVDIVIDDARVKHAFALARTLADIVMGRMDRGIHYDIIPGTQGESLLDPGAATLMNVVRVRPRHRVAYVREEDDGHVVLAIHTELVYWPPEGDGRPGIVVASGIGAVSTHETKYAYRWVEEREVPKDLDRTALRQRQRRVGGAQVAVYRVPNPDLGDLWNTLFKMAAKRSEVDAAQHLPGVAEALARIRKKQAG